MFDFLIITFLILNIIFIVYLFIFIRDFMNWFSKQNKKRIELLESINKNLKKTESANDFNKKE